MSDYHPDWAGAIITAVCVAVCLLVARKLYPSEQSYKRAIIVAGLLGVLLSFIFREILRYFGILAR